MADQSNEQWKQDDRPPRGWWAAGKYLCKCHTCGSRFFGDKRAGTCADCAYAELEPAPQADQSNEMGMVDLQTVSPERLQEALRLLPSVMRSSLSDTIISAINEQAAIIERFKRTSHARRLAFDAALSHDEVKG